MNVSLRLPRMTRDQFLDWAARQEAPYEFDGFEPVAMTGGTRRHGLICVNLLLAIRTRLGEGPFQVLLEAGLATVGNAVRYPDVCILRAGGDLNDRVMPGVVTVFEVVSSSSGRIDRTLKLREYHAVPSIQRYVIVETSGPDLSVFARPAGGGDWVATATLASESLALPEVGIDLPVSEIFAGVTFD